MKQYVDLIKKILSEGEERKDRTNVGTLSIFGGQIEFDLRERFPLVTVKKTLWRSSFIEMLWFLRGESNTKYLKDHNVPIWDAWADKDGNVGPIYGVQWRRWPGKKTISFSGDEVLITPTISNPQDWLDQPVDAPNKPSLTSEPDIDQVKLLINSIKHNPTGRRHIVSAWNPTYLNEMSLPPCHRDFQCYVTNDGHLDLMLSIRSWDTALGAPFNISQYALLTHLLARATNLTPGKLKVNYGDAHLYLDHVEAMREVVNKQPIDCKPQLVISTDNTDIDGYKPSDFDITGYESHPFIKLPIAV